MPTQPQNPTSSPNLSARQDIYDFFRNENNKAVLCDAHPDANDVMKFGTLYRSDYRYVIQKHPSKSVAVLLSVFLTLGCFGMNFLSDYFIWAIPLALLIIGATSMLFARRYRWPNKCYPAWTFALPMVPFGGLLAFFYFSPGTFSSAFALLGGDSIQFDAGMPEAYKPIWIFKVVALGIVLVTCIFNVIMAQKKTAGLLAPLTAIFSFSLFVLLFHFALTNDTISAGVSGNTFLMNIFLGTLALAVALGADIGLGFLMRRIYE